MSTMTHVRTVLSARPRRLSSSIPPAGWRVALATGVALATSLIADALLVAAGEAAFPSTVGYQHFRFSDYALFTILGVIAAGLSWPIVTRTTVRPRRFFARLAVGVSVVLLLPDVAIWLGGQPGRAVAVLALMHVAIAVLTYWSIMLLAPTRARPVAPPD
jgi:hypothetical protein